MNKKLAKITSAKLEIKERGILNFWIFVEYEEGGGQGIGGLALDEWDKDKKKRVGTAYGCEMIRCLLDTLSVNDFSEMKGKMIWVHGEGDGLRFAPKGVEPLKVSGENKEPLIFEDVFNEFGNCN
jgi:hypothetical protein